MSEAIQAINAFALELQPTIDLKATSSEDDKRKRSRRLRLRKMWNKMYYSAPYTKDANQPALACFMSAIRFNLQVTIQRRSQKR